MSEAAKIALLQEMMTNAKRSERGGLLGCIVGVIVSVLGFSTLPLAGNSINLGVLGLAIASVGFAVYLHYTLLYSKFVAQLANLAFKSATPCPKCGKILPGAEYGFCPFCGTDLNILPQPAEEMLQNEPLAQS
jgi:hypothetical protein